MPMLFCGLNAKSFAFRAQKIAMQLYEVDLSYYNVLNATHSHSVLSSKEDIYLIELALLLLEFLESHVCATNKFFIGLNLNGIHVIYL
jgi:hypothetical protein